MTYNDYDIKEHIVFKGIHYFVVVKDGLRKKVFFTLRHKRKWYLFDAQEILAGKKAMFTRSTLKQLRKDILEHMNTP